MVVRLLLIVMRMVITFLERRLMCQRESQDVSVISLVIWEFPDDGRAQGWGAHLIISTGAWPTARLWRFEESDTMLLDFVSPMPSTGPDPLETQRRKALQQVRENFQRHSEFSWVTKDERKLLWWPRPLLAKVQGGTKMTSQDPTSSPVWRGNRVSA